MAPAYDICHAYRPDSVWVSQQSLSINGKRKDITKVDLLSIAKSTNIKKAEAIIIEVSKIVARWLDFAQMVNVRPELSKAISRTLLTFRK